MDIQNHITIPLTRSPLRNGWRIWWYQQGNVNRLFGWILRRSLWSIGIASRRLLVRHIIIWWVHENEACSILRYAAQRRVSLSWSFALPKRGLVCKFPLVSTIPWTIFGGVVGSVDYIYEQAPILPQNAPWDYCPQFFETPGIKRYQQNVLRLMTA